MEEICSKYFIKFKLEDEHYTGIIENKVNYDFFINELRTYGYYFVIRNSKEYKSGNEGRFYFQKSMEKSSVKIPFFGSVFQIVKKIDFDCSQGPLKLRKQKIRQVDPLADHPGKKTKFLMQPSRKLNCPSTMHVNLIKIYSDFTSKSYKPGSADQTEIVKNLKEAISTSLDVKSNIHYYISISHERTHIHSLKSSCVTQNLHPKLIEERLVKKNICSTRLDRNSMNHSHRESIPQHQVCCSTKNEDPRNMPHDHELADRSNENSHLSQSKNVVKLGETLREMAKKVINVSYYVNNEEVLHDSITNLNALLQDLSKNTTVSEEGLVINRLSDLRKRKRANIPSSKQQKRKK